MRFGIFKGLTYASVAMLAFASADKKLPLEQSSNELVEISASLIMDKDQLKQELGSDLAGMVVVRLKVRPLSDKPVKIDRDDFTLLSTNDGQHSTPYAPSQIAGNSTLVVSPEGTRGSMAGRSNGPSFGGIPIGRRRGDGGGAGTGAAPAKNTATVKSDEKGENPLLAVLKEKVLPEEEVTEPVSGLLYFQMEGKVKAKDLELYYKTPSGKIALRFRP